MSNTKESKKHYLQFTGDVAWVGLYRVITYLFAFFTIPALTKSLGPELYGLWNQILVTIGLLTPILTLFLGTAAVRYLSSEKRKKIISQAFTNMLCIIILIIIIAVIGSILFKSYLSSIMFNSVNYSLFVVIAFLLSGVNALFDFMISYLRARGKIKQLSIINISTYFFMTLSLIILATLGYPLEFIALIYLTINLIFVIWLLISIKKDIGLTKPNFNNLRKFAAFGIPQIPSGILLWVLNLSDRYFITFYLGLAQTGIYSASYNIGSILTAFYMPISFVIFPVVSKYWDKGNLVKVRTYFEYATKMFLILAIPGSVGLYVLSKPLLEVLTTSQFVVGGSLTFFVALGIIFLGIFQINTYIIYLIEKTKVIPLITGISALINIVLNIVLIPIMGIIGAAISTLISYMILALITLLWAKNVVNYRLDFVFLFKVILSSIIMAFVLQYIVSSSIFGIFLAILSGSIIYIICIFAVKTLSNAEMEILYDIMDNLKKIVTRKRN